MSKIPDYDDWVDEQGPIVGFFLTVLALILCPLVMTKTLAHCMRYNCKYQIVVINFRYLIFCRKHEKIFVDEIS